MINDHTLRRFQPLNGHLLKPIYDDYSFKNIPATVHRLLTGETIAPLIPADAFGGSYPSPEKVVLVFVDSFGWQFWQRYLDRFRTLERVASDGILTPISALFPSTTAASVTTLNLGVPPALHAIYEWHMYVPAFGEVVQSLPFALLGQRPGSAATKGYDVANLFAQPFETAHQRLGARGVRSYQIAHRSYARSPYNELASAGADIVSYGTLAEGMVALDRLLTEAPGKAFINFYWPGLDTAAHTHGPGSVEHEAEVIAFWTVLDQLLGRGAPRSSDTLWLFTADHGHVHVPAAATIYVNERWPELGAMLADNGAGRPILPCGCPRDMFLHVRPERRDEALDLLSTGLGDIATVMTVDDAVSAGLFGEPHTISSELRRRIGDVLVLPHTGHFVWWHAPGLLENRLNGHHGGLTPDELITVLGVVGSL
ncbi:MAG: alkaline phosphatase family protein [Hyphomicrobiaceae bacterium]